MIELIAHRGFSAVAPENTLAAVRAAIEAGADAVEWDLHTASCGTPVLMHDANLGRTSNGFGPVKRRSLGQLRALDVGSWFSAEFAGERIATFAEALALVAGTDLRVYAEVKGYRELEDLDRMVTIVEAADLVDRVRFISLDFGIVDRIAGRNADLATGYVVDRAEDAEAAIAKAAALGERGGENGGESGGDRAGEGGGHRGMVDYDRRLVLKDPTLATRALDAGVEVAVWTVDDVEEADALFAAGVRRFTTNEVTKLREWRSRRRAG